MIVQLCLNDGVLFRTKLFHPDYRFTLNFVGTDAVDEVLVLDISRAGPSPNSWKAMSGYAERCFSPITMGGWVRKLEDVSRFMSMGADKVVIGRQFYENPRFLGEVARKYGAQAVVASVDYAKNEVISANSGQKTGLTPLETAKIAESEGAGEILLQNRDRDGSLLGYDLETLEEIASSVSIPVVVGSGCGGWRHMAEAFRWADGAATSVIHHFPENALKGFKRGLAEAGVAVRP